MEQSLLVLPLKVWRLRMYPNEKMLGAAKPLLYLFQDLTLSDKKCQRIL